VISKALFLSALVAVSLLVPASTHAKGHAPGVVFPMKAAEYKKRMDARIDKVRDAIDKKLDRSGVSSERKKADPGGGEPGEAARGGHTRQGPRAAQGGEEHEGRQAERGQGREEPARQGEGRANWLTREGPARPRASPP